MDVPLVLSPVGSTTSDNKPRVVPVENTPAWRHTTENRTTGEPPVQASTHFDVETLDFNLLTDRLLDCERRHGFSTLEMLRRFTNGEYDDSEDENIEEWFDYLYLYLGTEQIRRVSCP